MHKNSQDSVSITDPLQLPMEYKELSLRVPGSFWQILTDALPNDLAASLRSCVREEKPMNDFIRQAVLTLGQVPGACVTRGIHLRVV